MRQVYALLGGNTVVLTQVIVALMIIQLLQNYLFKKRWKKRCQV